jgi:hypothetical protein
VRAGIQVKPRFLAGEAEDEDVVLLVGVEIVDVGEEVVRVAIDAENLRLVVGVLFLKGRPFPPKRPRDDVGFAIAIDVADGGTFGVKVTVELPIAAAPVRPTARAQVLSTTVVPTPEGTAALRRLVILPGNPSPDATRTSMLAAGETKEAVTCVGVQAPAPVLLNLAGFFGNRVTPDSQKQLLETVQKGLAKPDEKPHHVQMVGWWPAEGVMAVAIDADDSGS